MATAEDPRILRLLDQLERPGISDQEIAKIHQKIELLKVSQPQE